MKYRHLTKKIKMKGETLKICIFLLKVLLILHIFFEIEKKKKFLGRESGVSTGGALNIRFTETIINK
jgi:hypothetical protein